MLAIVQNILEQYRTEYALLLETNHSIYDVKTLKHEIIALDFTDEWPKLCQMIQSIHAATEDLEQQQIRLRSAFAECCRDRNTLTKGSSLSFLANPMTIGNQLYFQIATTLYPEA